jgi:hypothetical protein
VDFARAGDVRWIIGGTVIRQLTLHYFVVVPVNIWLCAIPRPWRVPLFASHADWGLLE